MNYHLLNKTAWEANFMVTKSDILNSLKELGLDNGDTVLFHSSLKSFGNVENGADDVIDAFISAVGDSGTVVVPTLAMKNFREAYNTWNINKPSDTGLITEVFRNRPEALRSNQATHSVAAIGEKAEFLTKTHGITGKRYGIYGDTPFSNDSPWQKLFDINATVVMVGVDFEPLTFRHLCEYTLVEKALSIAKEYGKYDEYKAKICSFELRPLLDNKNLFWPYLNKDVVENEIIKNGFVTTVKCGNATLSAVKAKDVCQYIMENTWNNPDKWLVDSCAMKWMNEIKSLNFDKYYFEKLEVPTKELLKDQPDYSFIDELCKPYHSKKPDLFGKRKIETEEINLNGMYLVCNFEDDDKLLKTVYDDFNTFLDVYEIGGKLCPVTTIFKETSCFEEYTLEVSENGVKISAADTEGIRRGIYYLEDLIIASETAALKPMCITRKPQVKSRITRSCFSPTNRFPLNIDELENDVDYYPDEYLNRLAHDANNGVWIYTRFPDYVKSDIIKEYGVGGEKRIEKLKKVIKKCARYGIKVYVFAIEPAGLRKHIAENHKDMIGVPGFDGTITCCPRTEKGKEYCIESTQRLFTELPDLGGFIDITAGERVSSCCSVPGYVNCPRCSKYSRGENLSYVVDLVKEGMRRSGTKAEFISWTYGHREWIQEDILEYVNTAPDDVMLMPNFEEVGIAEQLGRKRMAVDYWVSYPGPADTFVSFAKQANKNGKHLYAKMQICNSHEIASVPYLPTPNLIFEKYKEAYKYNVEGVLQCWYIGNYPSIMSKAAGELSFTTDFSDENAFMEYLAAITYGKTNAKEVAKAWKCFSDGYRNMPLNAMFSYYGPMHDSIAWELSLIPKNEQLPRSWRFLDDLGGDRFGDALQSGHTLDEAITLCERMCEGWQNGVNILPEITGETVSVSKAINLLFKSGTNILKFYKLRSQLGYNEGNANEILKLMENIVLEEIENSKLMIELCNADCRLGYHAEAGAYKFYPSRIERRIEKLKVLLDTEFAVVRNNIISGKPAISYFVADGYSGYNLYSSEEYAGWEKVSEKGAFRMFHDSENLYLDISAKPDTCTLFSFEYNFFFPSPLMNLTNGVLKTNEWHRVHHSLFGENLERAESVYKTENKDFGTRIIINKELAGWNDSFPLKFGILIDNERWINDEYRYQMLAKNPFSPKEYGWILPQ